MCVEVIMCLVSTATSWAVASGHARLHYDVGYTGVGCLIKGSCPLTRRSSFSNSYPVLRSVKRARMVCISSTPHGAILTIGHRIFNKRLGSRARSSNFEAIGSKMEPPAVQSSPWGFPIHPTDHPPGSPTEENSPTRYEGYFAQLPYQTRFGRLSRPTWKVVTAKENGSWLASIKGARTRTKSKRRVNAARGN